MKPAGTSFSLRMMKISCRLLLGSLKKWAICVTALREAKAALRMVSAGTHHFDILITDFDMPTMSGAILAGLLPDLPVILVSGRDDARIAAKEYPNIHQGNYKTIL